MENDTSPSTTGEENDIEIQNGFNHDNFKPSSVCDSNLQSNYRQFHVLDEIENESDSKDSDASDSDVPDEEVERMLEEALVNRKRTAEQAGIGKLCYI